MVATAWSRLIVLLLALPLASCFSDESSCPTCPPENSASIAIVVPSGLDVDSLHVALDGGPVFKVGRGQERRFENLASGTHALSAVIFHGDFTGPTGTSTSELDIVLKPGEARIVLFHHDFPIVVMAPLPTPSAGVIVAAAATTARRELG